MPDSETHDQLKLLFFSFANRSEIINLSKDAIAAYQTLENYDSLGDREYLGITYLHLNRLALNQATLLGRIYGIRNSWNDALKKDFKKILNEIEIKRVESEFKIVDEQLRKVIPELQGTLNTELRSSIFNYSFTLFTPKSFPVTTWQKCGYIATAIIDLLQELQQEIPYENRKLVNRVDQVDQFEKEYARASLMSRSSLEFNAIWTEWEKTHENI